MRPELKTILDSIPEQPQRQDSITDQLQDLVAFAVRLGLRDADWIIRHTLIPH